VLRIVKAHAYGNDFLYVDEQAVAGKDRAALARHLCERRIGIGADGLVVFAPTAAGARMALLNADGSYSEVSATGCAASRPSSRASVASNPRRRSRLTSWSTPTRAPRS